MKFDPSGVAPPALVRAKAHVPEKRHHSIDGVVSFALQSKRDSRGSFSEIYRNQWHGHEPPVQWNLIHSHAGTLRGMHVHIRHYDYLMMLQGSMQLALRDLRVASKTAGTIELIELTADEPVGILIPPGILHGFYFPGPAMHLYSVSEYWCPEEEMGCHWSEPELAFGWHPQAHHVSERDGALGSLAELMQKLTPWQASLTG